MKVIYGQISPVVGDLEGNAKLITDAVNDRLLSKDQNDFNVFLFPELTLLGYPPLDLLLRMDFLVAVAIAEIRLIEQLTLMLNSEFSPHPDQCVIFGSVTHTVDGLLNSAVIVFPDRVERRHKKLLPTYDVFDERRWFIPGKHNAPIFIAGVWCGVVICEDVWNDKRSLGYENEGPVDELMKEQPAIKHLFVLNASPWHVGKNLARTKPCIAFARQYRIDIHYVNQVAGNDQLIFDGGSFCCKPDGIALCQPLFETSIASIEDTLHLPLVETNHASVEEDPKEITLVRDALVYGIREYMRKNGFKKAVIASSGGIDSAVVVWLACLAVDSENVHTIAMPGPFSSGASAELAIKLANNLKCSVEVLPIVDMYKLGVELTQNFPKGVTTDVSTENLQARLRGMMVMTYSNRTGAIVLTTGNKSELAVGYCTLYGDMCGGLAVIADVPKMMVYDLAKLANEAGELIPSEIIERPPSAELAPDQKDSDSLPPYEILDSIIEDYLDEEKMLVSGGLIRNIIDRIDKNEYKRQQSAPALKVTTKAFGMGRKRLISASNKWRARYES